MSAVALAKEDFDGGSSHAVPQKSPQSPPESTVCSLQSAVSPAPTFVMVSRLLGDKGVMELIEAGGLLKERGCTCRLVLVGDADRLNPNAVDEEKVKDAVQKGWIEWLGRRKDIPDIYAVLPSYYREGIPKSLIEATAAGLAIVTTDMPGCRELVRRDGGGQTADYRLQTADQIRGTEDRRLKTADISPAPATRHGLRGRGYAATLPTNEERRTKNLQFGANGILVPPRDAAALADAIEWLAQNPDERERMGLASRELAEQEFSIETVVEQTLAIYS